MFGDDAGLWQQDLFHRFIRERTVEDGSDLAGQLYQLFRVLNTPEHRRPKGLDPALNAFPYVNGDIFDGNEDLGLLAFTKGMRDALLEASAFDWTEVSPAVFGSLFQTVKSKEARRSAGEHYTTESNILKVLNPLFLEDYAARIRAAWDKSDDLKVIHQELANNVYMDPACGCGNFLVIAYRELRAIELKIIMRLRELEGEIDEAIDVSLGLRVSLDQFHGIEINWWPAKIAETAMFLVDHQANRLMAQALGVMSRDVVESVEGYAANRRVVSVVVVEVEPAGQRQASFGL